ncbi:MAG: sigma-70 family polymerase sigma factor [Bacilli bacterium]|nr:sigma-70 family polymerase sigma factor [Bacilli bacterium]
MDEELHRYVHEARLGNKEAFTELIRRFKGNVYRHAYGMLGERMEAEDVVQEAFIKAYYSLSRLESDYAFATWIMRIVSNLCLDRLKKHPKDQTVSNERMVELAAEQQGNTHLRITLEEAMQQLSPEHRQVILLHDVQGYRYEEMAALLDVPLGTVKSRLNAARLALRNELKKGDE